MKKEKKSSFVIKKTWSCGGFWFFFTAVSTSQEGYRGGSRNHPDHAVASFWAITVKVELAVFCPMVGHNPPVWETLLKGVRKAFHDKPSQTKEENNCLCTL